jgi:hypothetical protein
MSIQLLIESHDSQLSTQGEETVRNVICDGSLCFTMCNKDYSLSLSLSLSFSLSHSCRFAGQVQGKSYLMIYFLLHMSYYSMNFNDLMEGMCIRIFFS